MTNPEMRVGPQNPDAAAELVGPTGVGPGNSALDLIVENANLYPPEVMGAQTAPRDVTDSEAIDLDEVAGAVSDIEGAEIEDASVRGLRDRDKQVVVLYRVPSGRSAKAVLALDDLPRTRRQIEDARERAESADGGGVNDQHLAELRRQIDELRDAVAGQRSGDADGAEQLRRERDELRQEVERLRAEEAEDEARGGPEAPWDDYDELNAREIVERLRGDSAGDKQAVLAYERQNKHRDSIIAAADKE